MRIWHLIRASNGASRALANPKGILLKAHMFFRGWRPFNDYWWSKPNKTLAKILKEENSLKNIIVG